MRGGAVAEPIDQSNANLLLVDETGEPCHLPTGRLEVPQETCDTHTDARAADRPQPTAMYTCEEGHI